jgi:hypothetical protein
MFYGVIIYMFFSDDKKHHRPHIHAHYGDQAAVIAIDDGEVLQGDKRMLARAFAGQPPHRNCRRPDSIPPKCVPDWGSP